MGSLSATTVDRRHPRLASFAMPTPFWGSGGGPDSPGPCYLTLSCDVPTLPSLPNLQLLYAASKLCPEVLLHREMGQPGKNAPTAHHPSLGFPLNYRFLSAVLMVHSLTSFKSLCRYYLSRAYSLTTLSKNSLSPFLASSLLTPADISLVYLVTACLSPLEGKFCETTDFVSCSLLSPQHQGQ